MKKFIVVFAVIVGCSDGASSVPFGNSDGAGGSAAESSSSGSGGEGGSVDKCEARDDCKDWLTPECAAWLCVGGMCTPDYAPAGTNLEGNKPGDCRRLICDGAGNAIYEQIEDPEDDGNQCTNDTCSGFMTIHEPHVEGYLCDGGLCTAEAVCVECLYDFQCSSGQTCTNNVCQ